MKAFVTGATGFVGSHIAELLLERGIAVAALVRDPKKPRWLDRLPGAERVTGSLEDREALEKAMAGADLVFHAAGLVKARSEAEYLRANVEGTRSVVEAAALARAARRGGGGGGGGPRRLVHISSQAAHGPARDGRPATEDSPPRPITPYGRSKLAAERVVRERAGGMPATIIRPPAVYGPRDRDIFIYFRLAARGIVPVLGDGTRRIALVYVKDLARAAVDAALCGRAQDETYFITSGLYDWNEIARAVARAVGRGRLIRIPPWVLAAAGFVAEAAALPARRAAVLNRHKVREMLQRAWLCSHARAAEHFGYAPEWDLDRGMAATAAWYRKEGWIR